MEQAYFDYDRLHETRGYELRGEVSRAQAAVVEAQRRLNIAVLNLDAFRQEDKIRRELAQLSPEQRVPERFSPEVFDALSQRDIKFIVTGQ